MEGGSPKQSWENGTNRRVKTKNHLSVELGPRQPPRGPGTCEESPARRWEPVVEYSSPSGGAAAGSGCAHPPRLCAGSALPRRWGWGTGTVCGSEAASSRGNHRGSSRPRRRTSELLPAWSHLPPVPARRLLRELLTAPSLAFPAPPLYIFFFS